MKNLLILLLSILISFNTYGEETKLDFSIDTFCDISPKVQVRNGLFYLPNKQKPYSGENICVYLLNGQYYSQGKIKNGLRHGTWSFWQENGQISKQINYEDGNRDGKETWWDENGQKSEEVNYKDGTLVSKTKFTYHENGQIDQETTIKNGKQTSWDENGQIQSEDNYKDGTLVYSTIYSYYESGPIKNVWNRKGDKYSGNWTKDGKDTEWYENGQMQSEENYKDSIPDGKWTWWHENGQIDQEITLKDGKCISEECNLFICWETDGQFRDEILYLSNETEPFTGKSLCLYENGQIKDRVMVKDGIPVGKFTFWYENGQIDQETTIKDGKRDGKHTTWDENGQIQSEENYKDDTLVYSTNYYYYESGQIKNVWNSKGDIYSGNWTKDGKDTVWYENGQIQSEKHYKDDKKDGKHTTWYENGQIQSEENYKNDKLDGKFTFWYENGQKSGEGNTKDGKPDGKQTTWEEDGQILEEAIYKNGESISRTTIN